MPAGPPADEHRDRDDDHFLDDAGGQVGEQADTVADNLNPVGRMYYSFSNFLCVPNGLSRPDGYSLGAQAGEAALRQVATDGFTHFRRAAETPFNLVYEVRLWRPA